MNWPPSCSLCRTCDKQTALGQALGVKGVVRKRRMLYMIGQTRVHMDQVEGLGDFMELEVLKTLNTNGVVAEGVGGGNCPPPILGCRKIVRKSSYQSIFVQNYRIWG